MGYLSADAILGADDRAWEDVEVPEWGGTVRVRELSGTERDKFEGGFVGKNGKDVKYEEFRARLAGLSMVDEAGKRLFRTDAEVKRLGEKSAAALQRVVDVAVRLSGLSEDDVAELTGE